MDSQKKIINLSHLRSSGPTTVVTGQDKNQPLTSEIDSMENKPSTAVPTLSSDSRVINLSHLKKSIILNPPTIPDTYDTSSEEEYNGDGVGITNDAVRIRPNSSFLKRFVGGVERSNERKPIVCVATTDAFSVSIPEDKEAIVAELRAAAAVGSGSIAPVPSTLTGRQTQTHTLTQNCPLHKKKKAKLNVATTIPITGSGGSSGVAGSRQGPLRGTDDGGGSGVEEVLDENALRNLQKKGIIAIRKLAQAHHLKVDIQPLPFTSLVAPANTHTASTTSHTTAVLGLSTDTHAVSSEDSKMITLKSTSKNSPPGTVVAPHTSTKLVVGLAGSSGGARMLSLKSNGAMKVASSGGKSTAGSVPITNALTTSGNRVDSTTRAIGGGDGSCVGGADGGKNSGSGPRMISLSGGQATNRHSSGVGATAGSSGSSSGSCVSESRIISLKSTTTATKTTTSSSSSDGTSGSSCSNGASRKRKTVSEDNLSDKTESGNNDSASKADGAGNKKNGGGRCGSVVGGGGKRASGGGKGVVVGGLFNRAIRLLDDTKSTNTATPTTATTTTTNTTSTNTGPVDRRSGRNGSGGRGVGKKKQVVAVRGPGGEQRKKKITANRVMSKTA